jgi:hypothetical protein
VPIFATVCLTFDAPRGGWDGIHDAAGAFFRRMIARLLEVSMPLRAHVRFIVDGEIEGLIGP